MISEHSRTCLYAQGRSAEPDRAVCPACADLDYSPALNEDGTEFDIVKAAEIAKGNAVLDEVMEVVGSIPTFRDERTLLYRSELLNRLTGLRALASSPAPAGLDVERLARAEHAWTEWSGNKSVDFDDPRCECRERAEYVTAEYAGAATRPAEDAGT